jgi:inosose dehydratase
MNLAAFDTPVHKGDPFVRAGCSAITWSDDANKAIDDIAADGYAGIQLRAPTLDQYPDPHALRDLLAARKLTFVALSSGAASLDPAIRQSQLETHVKHAQYLHEAGGHYLQLTAGSAKPAQTFTAADYKLQGELFTEIGKRIADYGIKLGFHNHMSTVGQPPEAVDAILQASDPNYLFLELDVAHYLQGGGDPAAAIRKYGHRILFMHFKDVKNASTTSGYEWVELGKGRVDFPAIFAALHAVNFRGWGIVELDRVPAGDPLSPKDANAISLRFLREKFGVEA